MNRFRPKTFIAVLAGISLCSFAAYCAVSNDSTKKAASSFRAKSYVNSFELASRAPDSPQAVFLAAVSAHRAARHAEALPLLEKAEQLLPQLGDYALLYQAEALLKLNRPLEAATRATVLASRYPDSLLLRRSGKLALDGLAAAGDHKVFLAAGQRFIEKYPAGADAVEVLFLLGATHEQLGSKDTAMQVYRSIWLNNPASALAGKAASRIVELEKSAVRLNVFSAGELLQRAATLYALNEFSQSLATLAMISSGQVTPSVKAQINLKSGMAYFRLRKWKAAEKYLARAAGGSIPAVSSEARFWRARTFGRMNMDEQAFKAYMELAGEGSRQPFADDALLEAAGLRKSSGRYGEAAALYERLQAVFPQSKLLTKAVWRAAWCRYLAGDHARAAEAFRKLALDGGQREKALYWLGRSLAKTGSRDSGPVFDQLLQEYPVGFYAVMIRESRGVKPELERLANRAVNIEAPLPPGFEKAGMLASLGMVAEARNEATAARKKAGDKKEHFPGLAKLYLDMDEYGSAIALFMKNRPVPWDSAHLPIWSAGYPAPYGALVSKYTAENRLSEGLIYGLIRAESTFNPTIRSHAGAIGLMQLMPATAKATAREKGRFDVSRLVIPEYNIKLGTKHFSDLMKGADGDVIFSIAAYNAGAAAVKRWKKGMNGLSRDEFIENIPYQETRDYVKKVYASAEIYRQLYGIR